MTQWGLDTLFNPSKRHMDEEKQRLQSTREEVGDTSGGRRIDLESGQVTIRKSGGEQPEQADEAGAGAESVPSSASADKPADKLADETTSRQKSGRPMSDAQRRAAERRAAQRRAQSAAD